MKFKKQILMPLFLLLFSLANTVYAEDIPQVVVDGSTVVFEDVLPYVNNDRLLVPLRFVSSALQANVFWDAPSKEVQITNETLNIVLPLDSYNVVINGKVRAMDVKAQYKNGRIMVPLRFISEYLGAHVQWDGNANTAVIESEAYHKLDDYTVLIYLNGTDLESSRDEETGELAGSGSADLKEMMQVGSSAGYNFIIETGGTLQWVLPEINPEKTQRFYADRNQLRLQMEMDKRNMGEPESLTDFIKWGMKEFPAKKTGLILWNHGGGPIVGYGVDEWFDNNALTLSELDIALKNALVDNQKLSFVGFDACLMNSIETAATVKPYAEYLLASQELEPQGGWDYKNVLETITNTPYYQTETILKSVADGYKAHSTENGVGEDITLAVIALNKIDAIQQSARNLFSKMGSELSNKEALITIGKAIAKSKAFGGNTSDQGYTNLYDIIDFTSKLPTKYVTEINQLNQSVKEAVIYKVNGSLNEKANGMSVFLPYYDLAYIDDTLTVYNNLPVTLEQKEFVNQFSNALIVSGGDSNLSNSFTVYEPTSELPYYSIAFDTEHIDMVQDVYFRLIQYVETGEKRYRYLGYDALVTYDDNAQYHEEFQGAWTTFNGNPVSVQIVNTGDNFIEYEIPVRVNKQRMVIQAILYFTDEGGYYEIKGARAAIDSQTNMPDRKVVQLKKGDVIEPIYHSYYIDRDIVEEEIGAPFTLGDQISLDFQEISETGYLFEFVIYDFTGKIYYSDTFEYKK